MMDQDPARDVFVTGLRNAHALENQAISLMNRQIERIERYPEVRARMQKHVEETENQIKRPETLLGRMDEDASSLKDAGASLMGNLAAMGHMFSQDEILKNSYANFAVENYEIASYKSLCELAKLTGNDQALQPLQQSLQEEEPMATWLDQHLSDVTARYLQLEAAGEKSGI